MKSTVSKNIATLRVQSGLTQLELAEKLNYSDKAVSKWERGESLPDITAFCEMSEIFGVSVDDILKSEEIGQVVKKQKKERHYSLRVIKYVIDGFIWTVALLLFVVTVVINGGEIGYS
ncbi:MAG: helix-turn-helix transcriptional regulator, partial [Clostridia bacterium]|nr:helix-turn-helix transcriptional regulator [Clostridia bacterium]